MSAYNELINALHGKTKTQDGLNLPELKGELLSLFPQDSHEIRVSNRKQLQNMYSEFIEREVIRIGNSSAVKIVLR